MKEYAQLLSDINKPVQQKKMAAMEVNKSFQYKNFHHQYYFEPHFLQFSQSLGYKYGDIQQSFNTQLNYTATVSTHCENLQTQAVFEVLPKVEQPSIVQQLLNKPSNLESFLVNTRGQMKILSPHSIMTMMYNKRGKIFASSFVQKAKRFFFGCEGVFIKDHDKLMSAVAAGYDDGKTQVVVQINDQQSGCIGYLHQLSSMLKAAMKLNMRYINNQLFYEIYTGFQQQFDRGYLAVNANNNGIIQADMRFLISHNSVLQLVVTCDSHNGGITSGFSYTF